MMALHLPTVHLRWPRRHDRHATHWWTRQRWMALTVVARVRPDRARPAFGADAEYASELAAMRVELEATDRLMLVLHEPPVEDVCATGFAAARGDLPVPLDLIELELSAIPAVDATEVAFQAGARRAGGAA